jgi:hypothetical protein
LQIELLLLLLLYLSSGSWEIACRDEASGECLAVTTL